MYDALLVAIIKRIGDLRKRLKNYRLASVVRS